MPCPELDLDCCSDCNKNKLPPIDWEISERLLAYLWDDLFQRVVVYHWCLDAAKNNPGTYDDLFCDDVKNREKANNVVKHSNNGGPDIIFDIAVPLSQIRTDTSAAPPFNTLKPPFDPTDSESGKWYLLKMMDIMRVDEQISDEFKQGIIDPLMHYFLVDHADNSIPVYLLSGDGYDYILSSDGIELVLPDPSQKSDDEFTKDVFRLYMVRETSQYALLVPPNKCKDDPLDFDCGTKTSRRKLHTVRMIASDNNVEQIQFNAAKMLNTIAQSGATFFGTNLGTIAENLLTRLNNCNLITPPLSTIAGTNDLDFTQLSDINCSPLFNPIDIQSIIEDIRFIYHSAIIDTANDLTVETLLSAINQATNQGITMLVNDDPVFDKVDRDRLIDLINSIIIGAVNNTIYDANGELILEHIDPVLEAVNIAIDGPIYEAIDEAVNCVSLRDPIGLLCILFCQPMDIDTYMYLRSSTRCWQLPGSIFRRIASLIPRIKAEIWLNDLNENTLAKTLITKHVEEVQRHVSKECQTDLPRSDISTSFIKTEVRKQFSKLESQYLSNKNDGCRQIFEERFEFSLPPCDRMFFRGLRENEANRPKNDEIIIHNCGISLPVICDGPDKKYLYHAWKSGISANPVFTDSVNSC